MAGYNPYATNSYQGTQMFPQPQGNVYTLNNSMEIANIPVSGGISVGICPSENLMYIKAAVNNGLKDGFYGNQGTMKDGFYGIQGALAENRFAQQNCCCEIKSGIKDLSAEGYRNTCEITTAIHAEGEATRALINSNTMQELRDKLAEKDREVQARDFQLSQIAQTNNIVGQIRPCPVPAYVTCNPWGSNHNYNNGCGCGI